MNNYDTYIEVISILEKRNETEDYIVSALEKELSIDNRDLYFEVNEALDSKGYQTQFEVPPNNDKEFEHEEYELLITHVKKYKSKTEALMNYLKEIGFLNFSILNSSFILIKYLPDLIYFLKNKKIEIDENESLYNVYFMNYNNIEIRGFIENNIFNKIGIKYLELDYTRFHLDLEFMLWSITVNDNTQKSYLKVNTIKVACNIIETKFVEWNEKMFYDKKVQKNVMKYISLIPKELKEYIINKYQDYLDYFYPDGYKLLFNLL